LKNLGQGGRDMKNAAMEYLAETQKGAVNIQVQAELEALRAMNATMAEDLAALKAQSQPNDADKVNGDEFEGMDLPQLREFITIHTGQAPLGALNRKTLVRMARSAAPEKASAA
jgi:hypothetical protein